MTSVSNLVLGLTYFFAVTDYTATGMESPKSTEVSYQAPIPTPTPTPTPTPVPLNSSVLSAVSRKAHGAAGAFDINLPFTGRPGVECRTGGASGNHEIIVTFSDGVLSVGSVAVTSGSGKVASSIPAGNQLMINLTNVNNAQTIILALSNIKLKHSRITTVVSIPMAVLVGDTTGDRFVDSADISQTKSQSGKGVTSRNFREDLNIDGWIDSADISFAKSRSGTGLP